MTDGGRTTLRTPPCYTGFNGRLPDGYPIFINFMMGRAEHSAQSLPNICHTLGEREALFAPFSLINPRLEPRVLLFRTAAGGVSVAGGTPRAAWWEVYPG